MADTVDPLAGSFYIESLTDRVEQEALAYIAKIDEMGGAVAAIEQGYMQREIQSASYHTQMAIESGDQVVVGVNKFRIENEPKPELQKINPELERIQSERLAELRKTRDNALVDAKLAALRAAAKGTDNLMPFIVDAVKAYATLGEICNVMRDVFGEYQPAQW